MTTMTEEIQALVLARNAYETDPFLSIHASQASLESLVDNLRRRCDDQDRFIVELQAALSDERDVNQALRAKKDGGEEEDGSSSERAALSKSEARWKEKVDQLQKQLNEKLKSAMEASELQLQTANDLSALQESHATQEAELTQLRQYKTESTQTHQQLQDQIQTLETKTTTTLNQNANLKLELDRLERENSELKKQNDALVGRVVTEKESMMEQFNKMNDMMEGLQKEVEMLRLLQKQQEQRAKLFRGGGKSEELLDAAAGAAGGRRWGSMGVVVPSEPKVILKAHAEEIMGVRYDPLNGDLLATASSDSTVKVWNESSSMANKPKSTLRTNSGQPLLGVDVHHAGLVAGCCCDKTCRVWNVKTERMIHQLVGHGNKVTCVRFLSDGKAVLTGSADRTMKLWDIARNTYRVKSTLRPKSAVTCLDISTEGGGNTCVSGHVDGGVRFWDFRVGSGHGASGSGAVMELPSVHEGGGHGVSGVVSVQFDPSHATQLVTAGRYDATVCLVDARKAEVVRTFLQNEKKGGGAAASASAAGSYTTSSSCCFSPDGAYIAAASATTGELFIWRAVDGVLEKTLSAPKASSQYMVQGLASAAGTGGIEGSGLTGVTWGVGGSSGQQVATVDKNGCLVLWV